MEVFTGGRLEVEVLDQVNTDSWRCRISSGASAVIRFPDEWTKLIPTVSSLTILEYSVSWQDDLLHIQVDSHAVILLHPSKGRGQEHLAEMFGGLSGWSWAARECGHDTLMIVEKDSDVAQACAKAHACEVIDADTGLERALAGTFTKTTVIQACVDDPKVWMMCGILNVTQVMASPPCPPWSSAGSECGLQSPDGMIFCKVLKWAGQLKLIALTVENVPGICKHVDFERLIVHASLNGMSLILAGVYSCQRSLPLYRDRWLATFVHHSVYIEPTLVQSAVKLSLADEMFCSPMPGPSLAAADALHPACASAIRASLLPSSDVLAMLERSDLVPVWMSCKINWSLSNPVLSARSNTGDMKLSGVMARYGSQHLLPMEHLKAKGLQTMLLNENGLLRLFSPWEVLAALGFPAKVVISSDLTKAFQQSGNAISPVHAWLQIVKTHMILGHLSLFDASLSPTKTLAQILANGIKLSVWEPIVNGDFAYLESFVDKVEDESPSHKRAKIQHDEGEPQIPPTVPFCAEETVLCTRQVGEPKFVIDGLEGSSKHAFCKGGFAFLQHVQKNWLMVVHGSVDEMLSELIVRAMPHARIEHFESFTWMKREVQWHDHITCAPPATVTFQPCTISITCHVDNGMKVMLSGDVTWTTQTVAAFVAAHIGCNIDALRIMYEGLPTKPCDFVAEFPIKTFTAKFQACLPGYAAFHSGETQTMECGMIPAHNGCVRFVAKHPTMKVLRTISASTKSTIADVVRQLLPDLCSTVTWTAHVEGVPTHPDAIACNNRAFEIEWDCFKPLAPTKVCVCSFSLPIDTAQVQLKYQESPQRWIKSPFKTKACIARTDEQASLMDVAASFVSHAQLDVNMTCHVNGRMTDPSILLSDVPTSEVICFKLAPLLGGVKRGSHDAVKQKIIKVLEMHGVAKETCSDRAAALLQKADIETLAKHEHADDEQFWKEVKSEANRVHFRLVFRNEMQQAKRDNRKKPPAKPAKKSKQSGPHDNFVPTATNVMIDVKHFWDGEDNMEIIEQSRFGPDQKGLAVMSLEDANRLSHDGSISVDALAVLVIGRKFDASDMPFAMPAITTNGDPVVIQAALRQYGDRIVTFKAAVPVSQVDGSASTVVELHIYRSEVSAWKECSVPLHYLGVHISAVRGSSLIATWALKTWGDSRSPAPFREAQYWHGYIRVHDETLDQVLSRSGHAGIYVSPKDPNRRHDDRFAVVALPDCSLQDALKKACNTEKALGVVRLRDQLGIRCRREFAASLRATLLPESAYVADEGVGHEETVWILKNIPCEVGKDGVQKALQQSGWEAKPIRAQGQDRWLIAAKTEPPYRHFCINGSFVLVESLKKPRDGSAFSITAKQVRVDTVMSPAQNGMQVATTTRIQEVKAEISDQFEQKLQVANDRIAQLASALETFQTTQQSKDAETKNELAMVRQEQAFAKQKIGEVESSIMQSSQTVIATMQTMMAQMQTNLESSMKQFMATNGVNDDGKRPRSDQGSREDPFAPKA
eukprot:s505_g16.t1